MITLQTFIIRLFMTSVKYKMPFEIYITNILTEEIPYDADHESWFNEVPNIIFIV